MDEEALRATVDDWLSILDTSSYYDLLGILEVADDSAIQLAFHQFSASFHPDNHRSRPGELREKVTQIYRRGAEAYGVLRDPKSRAAYDLELAQGMLRLSRNLPSAQSAPPTNLEGACKTPAGKMHARQVERALANKEPDEAFALFEKLRAAEGENEELEERFEDLFAKIYRRL